MEDNLVKIFLFAYFYSVNPFRAINETFILISNMDHFELQTELDNIFSEGQQFIGKRENDKWILSAEENLKENFSVQTQRIGLADPFTCRKVEHGMAVLQV